MTFRDAIQHGYRLQEKWVGKTHEPGVGFELDRIHASMLRESRWHRTGKSSATIGLIKEVKGELVLLGKIRNTLCREWPARYKKAA